jgi:transcriptional regulator with XRE-family HTH domain
MPTVPDFHKYEENQVYNLAFGKVILNLRERRGWTQTELATRVGITQSMLSRLESGKAQVGFYETSRLAQSFGLTTDQLNRQVQNALNRAQKAADSAAPEASSEGPWWHGALKVAGLAGLAALVVFAVAAALNDDEQNPTPEPPKPPSP